jgi:hypothetical protein
MIIGLQGYAGSGKSTVAKYLEERHGFARRHIKQPIADMVASLIADAVPMGFDDDIYRYLDGDLKRTPIPALGNRSATEIQQFLGTEFGRNFIHPDIWLDIWSAWAAQHPKVVQESVRFANEAARCDVIWEVRRPGYGALNGHVSESLPSDSPNAILTNDGSEAGLYAKIDALLAVTVEYEEGA